MKIWPRLSRAIANAELDRLKEGQKPRGMDLLRDAHWRALGTRVDGELGELRKRVKELAARHGFPSPGRQDAQAQFDRHAAFLVRDILDTTFAEAAAEEVWSFVALGALPEVTVWRFGVKNRERFIATDIPRHTWGRLWWQGEAFGPERELLSSLSEGDLNQLFERRSIGGDGALVRALTSAFLRVEGERRLVVRDATKRMQRLLAFVETTSLEYEDLRRLVDDVVAQSAQAIEGAIYVPANPDEVADAPTEESHATAPVLDVPVVRERVLGQVEPIYRIFRRSAALSSAQLLSSSVLRSVVAGALQIEGPLTRRRLRRLVGGANDGQALSQSAAAAIEGAIDLMTDGGQIEIDEAYRAVDQDDHTLRLRGTPQVRIRPRGDRDLQDVPLRELVAVASLAPGRARIERIAFLREFYELQTLSDAERSALLNAVAAAEDVSSLETRKDR